MLLANEIPVLPETVPRHGIISSDIGIANKIPEVGNIIQLLFNGQCVHLVGTVKADTRFESVVAVGFDSPACSLIQSPAWPIHTPPRTLPIVPTFTLVAAVG